MRLVNIILYYFLFSLFLPAQEIQFEKKDIPLPSPEAYSVVQDGDGYIWISTDQGYCRYNGQSLKIYDSKNGLPENSVYAAKVDSSGRVWALTAKNRVFYTHNGDFKEAAISKELQKDSSLASYNHLYSLSFDYENSALIINSLYDAYSASLKENSISRLTKNTTMEERTIVLEKHGEKLTSVLKARYLLPFKTIDIYIKDSAKNRNVVFYNVELNSNHTAKIPFTLNFEGKDVISFSNYVFFINKKNHLIKKAFPARVIYTYVDQDNGFWVGVLGNGVYYYRNGDILSTPIRSLREYSVSGVLEDREGNIWVTTLENGVYFSKNKNLISYTNIKGMDKTGSMLSKFKKNAYFASYPNVMYEVSDISVKKYKLPDFTIEPITDLEVFNNKVYVGSKYNAFVSNYSFDTFVLVKDAKTHLPVSLFNFESDTNSLYGTINHWYYQIIGNVATLKGKMPFYIRDFEYIGQSKWLFGDRVLYEVDFNKGSQKLVADLGFPISDICNVRNNVVLIATKGGGLFQYSNGELVSHKHKLGLKTDVIYDITEDKYGNIWLATNQGVVRVASDYKSVVTFTENDGLLSNVTQKIQVVDDIIYMSTTSGLCAMNIHEFSKNKPAPQLQLTQLIAKGRGVMTKLPHSIPFSNNTLSFIFDILYYKSNNIRLVYALEHNHSVVFKNSNSKEVDLQNLSSGEYKLTVWAETETGIKSNYYTTTFVILKPLWLNWWFITLEVLLLSFLVFFSMHLYARRIKRREMRKTKIKEMIANSKLSALQAQMNPHFIFNAISSIQNFVLKKDAKQAYAYLTKFSKLIRLVLRYSRRKLISLEEELELLRLYISLEQLRFDQKFDFIETIEQNVDLQNVLITPMFIQPFLENAVWHGISPLEGNQKGKITLRVLLQEDVLQIEIEDNGVGRSFNNAKSESESLAIKLTEERLQIVNTLYKSTKASMQFVDLFENNKPVGTKIILTLPLLKEE